MKGSFAECGLLVVSRNWSCSLYMKEVTARTEGVDGSTVWWNKLP
jgi:hypothetical protein